MSVLLYGFLIYFSFLIIAFMSLTRIWPSKDVLYPVNVFFLWKFIEVPYLLYVSQNGLTQVVYTLVGDFNYLYCEFLLWKGLEVTAFGIVVSSIDRSVLKRPVLAGLSLGFNYKLILAMAFGAAIFYLHAIGGVMGAISSIHSRGGERAVSAYLDELLRWSAIVGIIFFRRETDNKLLFFALFMFFAMVSALSGSRAKPIIIVFTYFIVANYLDDFFKLKMRYVMVLPLLLFFISSWQLFRYEGAIDRYSANPGELLIDALNNNVNTLSRFSDIDTSIYLISTFGFDKELWAGRTFLNLVYAPIPRSMFKDKPPVDDGVYIFSKAAGLYVDPPMPMNKLAKTSWPATTISNFYLNFDYVGLIGAAFFNSFLMITVYRIVFLTRNTRHLLWACGIYSMYVLNSIKITTLGIVNVLMCLIVMTFVLEVAKNRGESKK